MDITTVWILISVKPEKTIRVDSKVLNIYARESGPAAELSETSAQTGADFAECPVCGELLTHIEYMFGINVYMYMYRCGFGISYSPVLIASRDGGLPRTGLTIGSANPIDYCKGHEDAILEYRCVTDNNEDLV